MRSGRRRALILLIHYSTPLFLLYWLRSSSDRQSVVMVVSGSFGRLATVMALADSGKHLTCNGSPGVSALIMEQNSWNCVVAIRMSAFASHTAASPRLKTFR